MKCRVDQGESSRFALTSILLLISRSNTLSQTIPHVETLHVDGTVKSKVTVTIVRNMMTGATRVVLTIELPIDFPGGKCSCNKKMRAQLRILKCISIVKEASQKVLKYVY